MFSNEDFKFITNPAKYFNWVVCLFACLPEFLTLVQYRCVAKGEGKGGRDGERGREGGCLNVTLTTQLYVLIFFEDRFPSSPSPAKRTLHTY